ncbi:hypothetical protein [Desulfatiglans anilini]|uniref:hypothetical protein n=1 Tax=Desulfatiglans anilini TaxID=90728 RepID=UPI0012946867|nr:hypothetical protein [Desulfatiglans anilini]
MKRDEIIGPPETRKTDQKADPFVDLIDSLEVFANVFRVVEIDGLKKFYIIIVEAVVYFEKAQSIGIAAETALQLGRMFERRKCPQKDVCRVDAKRSVFFRADRFEGAFFEEVFRRERFTGIHLHPLEKNQKGCLRCKNLIQP